MCRTHYKSWWKTTRRGTIAIVSPLVVQALFGMVDPATCTTECDVAWLAGLLEGEGSFGIAGHKPNGYPVIKVEMAARDVIERAAEMLGSSAVRAIVPDHPKWSVTYEAKISGTKAADWMRRLRPLMGSRRGAAIDAALAAYNPIRLVDPPLTCVVPDCGEPHRSRGLCHRHYMSWSRDIARGRAPRITPLR